MSPTDRDPRPTCRSCPRRELWIAYRPERVVQDCTAAERQIRNRIKTRPRWCPLRKESHDRG